MVVWGRWPLMSADRKWVVLLRFFLEDYGSVQHLGNSLILYTRKGWRYWEVVNCSRLTPGATVTAVQTGPCHPHCKFNRISVGRFSKLSCKFSISKWSTVRSTMKHMNLHCVEIHVSCEFFRFEVNWNLSNKLKEEMTTSMNLHHSPFTRSPHWNSF